MGETGRDRLEAGRLEQADHLLGPFRRSRDRARRPPASGRAGRRARSRRRSVPARPPAVSAASTRRAAGDRSQGWPASGRSSSGSCEGSPSPQGSTVVLGHHPAVLEARRDVDPIGRRARHQPPGDRLIAISTTPAPARWGQGASLEPARRAAARQRRRRPSTPGTAAAAAAGIGAGCAASPHARSRLAKLTRMPGGGTPDEAALIGQYVVAAGQSSTAVAVAALVERLDHEVQRHLERVGDLVAIEPQRERRRDPADHRMDAKAGHRVVGRELAQHLDPGRIEPDLLLGLAQRRGRRPTRRRARSARPGS